MMNAEHEGFPSQLPMLLQLLADPTTTHTTVELWCRIRAFGWGECVPVMQVELESGAPEVKRLVLGILHEELAQAGLENLLLFVPRIVSLLDDSDRTVRMAAIQAVRDLQVGDAVEPLRRIINDDEPILAAEALVALLEMDRSLLDEVLRFVRDRASQT